MRVHVRMKHSRNTAKKLRHQQKITQKNRDVAEYIGLLFYTIHIYNLIQVYLSVQQFNSSPNYTIHTRCWSSSGKKTI